MIDNKRATALAVTSLKRVGSLPTVPTLAEIGIQDFEMQSWQGVFVPAGTPTPIVNKLGDTLTEILQMSDVREKLLVMGVEPSAIRGSDFRDFQKNEITKWSKVLQDAGVKPE
jgi:tripartite-type tricarboxylate transporter receptor subunit TctC